MEKASTQDDPTPFDAPHPDLSQTGSQIEGQESVPSIADFFKLDAEHVSDDELNNLVNQIIKNQVKESAIGVNFNIFVIHSELLISRYIANKFYSSLVSIDNSKPLLLILDTPGGDVAAAYMISKLCREYTRSNFEIAVPRRAKSAGTLVCCGADKIHMGGLSELGPIDPQFDKIPALALKHSIEHIAELVDKYPGSSQMFSEYLAKSLRVEALGYFERVAESAAQYALRLLNSRIDGQSDEENEKTACRLVYSYKDHGFVIDAREAKLIFGEKVVHSNTQEYKLANSIYETLDLISFIIDKRFFRKINFVGGHAEGCMSWEKNIDE